jgi:hypothetical protein
MLSRKGPLKVGGPLLLAMLVSNVCIASHTTTLRASSSIDDGDALPLIPQVISAQFVAFRGEFPHARLLGRRPLVPWRGTPFLGLSPWLRANS